MTSTNPNATPVAYPWLSPPTISSLPSSSTKGGKPLPTAPSAAAADGKPRRPERADCSHNFIVGKDRVYDLMQDTIANRSRVMVVDDTKTQQSLISFKDKQAMTLAAALRNNNSYLAVALRSLSGLSGLGLQPILYELSRHPRVRVVDLCGTIVPPECFAGLKDMVRLNSNIICVELDGCGVPEDVVAAIVASCKVNLMSNSDVVLPDAPSPADILRLVVAECDAKDARNDEAAAASTSSSASSSFDVAKVLEKFRKRREQS